MAASDDDGAMATSEDEGPREGTEKTERAVAAMDQLGLKRAVILKTLKLLHKVYEKEMWNMVEMENYRLLADAAFDRQERREKKAREAENNGTVARPSYSNGVLARPKDIAEGSSQQTQLTAPKKIVTNGYPRMSETSLKVLATNVITQGEEDERERRRAESTRSLLPTQKTSSLLHSRGGVTPRTDGRGVKMVDVKEASPAIKRPENHIVHRKLKQPREEFDLVQENEWGHKKLKQPQEIPDADVLIDDKEKLSSLQVRKKLKRPQQDVEANSDAGGKEGKWRHNPKDLSRGWEAIPIPIVNHSSSKSLPPDFIYISKSQVHERAHINSSTSRIGDDDCCHDCYEDCLTGPYPCACTRETGGEFAYTSDGRLRERYIEKACRNKLDETTRKKDFCESGFHCPEERNKNESNPAKCKGHYVRDFVKECSWKCGCSKQCGNRVVQRGISCRLEVFLTPEGKGWGIRTLEDLPAGSFVFEYIGEILTNTEMYYRNLQTQKKGEGFHTYPITLDGDWTSEKNLKDEEALCLDATEYGNVARFLNHRCSDANLLDMPVEIETPDRHYYHVAFFTNRHVKAMEELNWDYGIDFEDTDHPIKAFVCLCKSKFCRDNQS